MGENFVGGIRIQFPNTGGIPVQKVIPMLHRPYKHPLACNTCVEIHKVKTYHLNLDAEGITIVSREVAERLREGGVEFTVLNVVSKPPKMRLNIGGMSTMFRVEEKKVTA